MDAPSTKQAAGGGGKSARTRSSPSPRGVLFALACVIFAASSWVAFRQPGRADPLREPRVLGREWLFAPVEHNAILGRPDMVGGLRAITGRRTPGGGVELWAVGDGGMILRSPDGGASWERRAIQPPPPVPATAPPGPEHENGADGDGTGGGGRSGGAGSQNAPAPSDGAPKSKKVRTQRDMNVSSRGPAMDSIDAAHGLGLAAGWALAGALLAEPPPRPNVDTKANEVGRASNAGRQSNEPPPRGSSFNAGSPELI